MGAVILLGALALAGLVFVTVAAMGAFGGTTGPGQQLGMPLAIVLIGGTISVLMIAGGRMSLASSDPVVIRRGALLQAIPAAIVAGLAAVFVLASFVLPNIGSGRYYHDYSVDYDLADEIQSDLAFQQKLRGIEVEWISIDGVYASELGVENADDYLVDYLCRQHGMTARSERATAEMECGIVTIQFKRAGKSYLGHVPVHNLVDNVTGPDTYRRVAVRRITALFALDNSHWARGVGGGYYLDDFHYSAPFLTN